MPKVRQTRKDTSTNSARRAATGDAGWSNRLTEAEKNRPCIANDHCPSAVVPDAPVALCGKHLREVYAFAADMVSRNWDSAVRDYVSTLHGTFSPPRAVKQPLTGWVYFIRFGDRVKIGYTTRPDERLKGLPHEEVLGVVPGSRDDEAAWHRLLSDFHVVGEWFRAEPELLAVLNKVTSKTA